MQFLVCRPLPKWQLGLDMLCFSLPQQAAGGPFLTAHLVSGPNNEDKAVSYPQTTAMELGIQVFCTLKLGSEG